MHLNHDYIFMRKVSCLFKITFERVVRASSWFRGCLGRQSPEWQESHHKLHVTCCSFAFYMCYIFSTSVPGKFHTSLAGILATWERLSHIPDPSIKPWLKRKVLTLSWLPNRIKSFRSQDLHTGWDGSIVLLGNAEILHWFFKKTSVIVSF